MPMSLLTDIAETKLSLAAGSASQVQITDIALGDGNGVAYNPTHGQTALARELARRPIESRIRTSTTSWRVKTEFPPTTASFDVREIGFFDADGDLIAIWAGADVTPRKTGVISYLLEHVLDFSRVDNGLVIVDAPHDDLFDHALQNIHTHAIIAGEQFKQRLLIRDLILSSQQGAS